MAPTSQNDIPTIGIKCFEITKMLCDHNLAFTFKVTFGDFCFELDTREIKASSASGPVKTKKKSPSFVERDRRRRMDFLKPKTAASSQSSAASLSVPATSSAISSGADSHSSANTPGPTASQRDTDQPESIICFCGALPCLCLASHQFSAKENQVVSAVKLRKSASGWTTKTTHDGPDTSSPTLSAAPVCANCGEPFLGPLHQCGDQEDLISSRSNELSGPAEVDILDLNACQELVLSDFHTPDEKHSILQKNCMSILKVEPINIPAARYCFGFAQYYKLVRENSTLGYSMDYLVNKVFYPQFDVEISKLG